MNKRLAARALLSCWSVSKTRNRRSVMGQQTRLRLARRELGILDRGGHPVAVGREYRHSWWIPQQTNSAIDGAAESDRQGRLDPECPIFFNGLFTGCVLASEFLPLSSALGGPRKAPGLPSSGAFLLAH